MEIDEMQYPIAPAEWASEEEWEKYREACDAWDRVHPPRPMNRFEQAIWDARGGPPPTPLRGFA